MTRATTWHEVVPGVVAWAAHSPEHKVELRSHAVATPDGWLVFDPIPLAMGWPEALGRVRAVVLTNGNHLRDAAAWSAGGIPVWAPGGVDPEPGVVPIAGPGEAGTSGARVIDLAGGGPGETAWWFPGRSLMVFGDAVVNLRGRGLELLPDRYCSDPVRLRRSLRAGLPPGCENAVFAHGEPLFGDASGRLASLLSTTS